MEFAMTVYCPKSPLFLEVVVRLVLTGTCLALEYAPPLHRAMLAEEVWRYRYPHSADSVSTPMLVLVSLTIPTAFFIVHFLVSRNKTDFIQAILGLSLSILLTCLVSNVIKICVGRPRPDFFARCFPGGETPLFSSQCNGPPATVQQGLKSFPSGHSAFMFASFGFLSLYLSGKLHIFQPAGRGRAWRLCVVLLPLLAATVVAVSRMKDHKHHWEDVLVGGLLGISMATLVYLQHFPSPLGAGCGGPHPLEPTPTPLPHPSQKPSLNSV